MKVVLQRVNSASVSVDGEIVGAIERGILLLVGFGKSDHEGLLRPMAEKLCAMRIFPDGQKNFHLSLKDIQGGALLVPQFTLFADTSKGRRPEFFGALESEKASALFNQFLITFKDCGISKAAAGKFGAHMQVSLVNDGPVTILLES